MKEPVSRTHVFDSWSAFVDHAARKAPEHRSHDCYGRGNDWRGEESWTETLRLAREGWQSAITEAETFAARIDQEITTQRFQTTFEPVWDVSGPSIDIGRFLSDEPECFVDAQPIRIARHGRVVRVVVNIGALSNVDPRAIRRRGAAVLALCDILARGQHPLEVWAVSSCSRPHLPDSRLRFVVQVHGAQEPLDLGKVMFALAHPAALRRLVFSARLNEPDSISYWGIGVHGSGIGVTQDITEDELPPADGTTVILNAIKAHEDWSEAKAVAWIEDTLRQLFGEE